MLISTQTPQRRPPLHPLHVPHHPHPRAGPNLWGSNLAIFLSGALGKVSCRWFFPSPLQRLGLSLCPEHWADTPSQTCGAGKRLGFMHQGETRPVVSPLLGLFWSNGASVGKAGAPVSFKKGHCGCAPLLPLRKHPPSFGWSHLSSHHLWKYQCFLYLLSYEKPHDAATGVSTEYHRLCNHV